MRNPFVPLAALLAVGFVATSDARAQFVTPTGYSFSIAPNSNGNYYPDSGGELTDGVLGLSFSHYANEFAATAWTGWVNTAGPTISFQFSSAQSFSRIEIGTTRHDGASVGLPATVTITGTAYNFSSGTLANDTRDWLVFDGTFGTSFVNDIPTLSIAFGASYLQWLMVDEVRFTAVPEPGASAAIIGAALACVAVVMRRRRFSTALS